ncbi:MAG: methyltransferase type 12 [Myxococcales bacterium]|nr:methyltransferase type 12 [Myxococcales bacterium]
MSDPNFDSLEEQDRLRRIADRYQGPDSSITEQQANEYMAREAGRLVEGPKVLVLGAATGVWAEPLIARFGGFDTVDAVEHLVQDLERQYPGKVRGFVSLFEEFDPSDTGYDTIVLGHVLEHLHNPVDVLTRCRSWLRPGGRVVILVPNAHSLHRQVGVSLGYLEKVTDKSAGDLALGHRRVYTWDSLRADVEAAEFTDLHLSGLFIKPLSNQQMDEFSDELRIAFFQMGPVAPELACVICCVAKA